MRSCPERAYILAFFAPPPPLSDENPVMLHFFAYAEIIFAHILVFPACAIEVQHIDENSPTLYIGKLKAKHFGINLRRTLTRRVCLRSRNSPT